MKADQLPTIPVARMIRKRCGEIAAANFEDMPLEHRKAVIKLLDKLHELVWKDSPGESSDRSGDEKVWDAVVRRGNVVDVTRALAERLTESIENFNRFDCLDNTKAAKHLSATVSLIHRLQLSENIAVCPECEYGEGTGDPNECDCLMGYVDLG